MKADDSVVTSARALRAEASAVRRAAERAEVSATDLLRRDLRETPPTVREVLVVDDDHELGGLVADFLRDELSVPVRLAVTLGEAWRIVHLDRPRVVVCDWRMGGATTSAALMRALPRGVGLVVLSGYAAAPGLGELGERLAARVFDRPTSAEEHAPIVAHIRGLLGDRPTLVT